MSVPMETNSEPPRAWLMGRPKWPAINLPLVGLHSPSLRRCVSPCLKLRLKMTAFQRITNNFYFKETAADAPTVYLNLSVVEMGRWGGGACCRSTINMEFTHSFTSNFLRRPLITPRCQKLRLQPQNNFLQKMLQTRSAVTLYNAKVWLTCKTFPKPRKAISDLWQKNKNINK